MIILNANSQPRPQAVKRLSSDSMKLGTEHDSGGRGAIRKRETRAGNAMGREIALALSSFPSLLVSGTQTTMALFIPYKVVSTLSLWMKS